MRATSGCWGAAAGIVQRSDLTLRANKRSQSPMERCYGSGRIVLDVYRHIW